MVACQTRPNHGSGCETNGVGALKSIVSRFGAYQRYVWVTPGVHNRNAIDKLCADEFSQK
jgi:hypothetical protein